MITLHLSKLIYLPCYPSTPTSHLWLALLDRHPRACRPIFHKSDTNVLKYKKIVKFFVSIDGTKSNQVYLDLARDLSQIWNKNSSKTAIFWNQLSYLPQDDLNKFRKITKTHDSVETKLSMLIVIIGAMKNWSSSNYLVGVRDECVSKSDLASRLECTKIWRENFS